MMVKSRLLIAEYATASGMSGATAFDSYLQAPLPLSIKREGDGMVQALARDLADLSDLSIMRHRSLMNSNLSNQVRWIVSDTIDDITPPLNRADFFWPIAPEEKALPFAQLAPEKLVTSRPDAIQSLACKSNLKEILTPYGVQVPPTFRLHRDLDHITIQRQVDQCSIQYDGWTIKNDSGAGCKDMYRLDSLTAILALSSEHRRIIQPWIVGDSLSLSVLCDDTQSRVLSINQQILDRRKDGSIDLIALKLGSKLIDWQRAQTCADQVKRAVPGLWGLIGIDCLLTADGDILVVDINPRLTSAYPGLPQACGFNPAGFVLKMAHGQNLDEMPAPQRRCLDLRLN